MQRSPAVPVRLPFAAVLLLLIQIVLAPSFIMREKFVLTTPEFAITSGYDAAEEVAFELLIESSVYAPAFEEELVMLNPVPVVSAFSTKDSPMPVVSVEYVWSTIVPASEPLFARFTRTPVVVDVLGRLSGRELDAQRLDL